MSIEYTARPNPELDEAHFGVLFEQLCAVKGLKSVRRSESELGLAIEPHNIGVEAITVVTKPDEVYIGFHAATRIQRDQVLTAAREILRDLGYQCSFDEL